MCKLDLTRPSRRQGRWLSLIFLMLPLLAGAQPRDPDMVIFGDSLSDSGNYFRLFDEWTIRPFEPIPSSPYARGWYRFSNGYTWVEQLAWWRMKPRSAKPSLKRPGQFTNYAFGRARARPDPNAGPSPDLTTQVGMFLNDFGGMAPSESTYIVFLGSNDARDALEASQIDPSGATSAAIIGAAVAAIANNIGLLYGTGAREFLVPNIPDLGITPGVRALGPVAQAGGTQISMAFNGALEQALMQLDTLPDIQIRRMDLFGLLNDVVDDPRSAWLRNATDSCITPGVTKMAVCRKPHEYLFWDFAHPTQAAHRYLAWQASRTLDN